jgi:streptogramin lyase
MSGPNRHTTQALLFASLFLSFASGTSDAADAPPDSAAFAPYELRTERIFDRDALEAVGIRRPARLAYDSEGNLHVLDSETRHVVKLDPRGRVLYDVGGYGQDETSLELPVDIAVDRDQSLLVLDRGRGAIVAYDRAGRFLGQRLFQGAAAEEAREPGARILLDRFGKLWLLSVRDRDLVALDDRLAPARTTRYLVPEDSLRSPMAVALSRDGEIWVYDAVRVALLRFDPSGRLRSTLRLTGARVSISDLAMDRAGYVYAADRTQQDVKGVGPGLDHVVTLRVMGGDTISWRPGALTVGPARQIALADPDRPEIQILTPQPRVVRSAP